VHFKYGHIVYIEWQGMKPRMCVHGPLDLDTKSRSRQTMCKNGVIKALLSVYYLWQQYVVVCREWHGNGECGNTAVTAVITVGWVEFHGNTVGTVPSVRYYHGNGNASAVITAGISAAESRNCFCMASQNFANSRIDDRHWQQCRIIGQL